MVCVQETKLSKIDRRICSQLWPDDDFEWVGKPFVGRAGGLLIMWSKVMFELLDCFEGEHFMGVVGGGERLNSWSH